MYMEHEQEIAIPNEMALYTLGSNNFFFTKTITWFKERIAGHNNKELRLGRKIIAEIYKNTNNFNGQATGKWNTDVIFATPETIKKIGSRFTKNTNAIYPAIRLAGDFQVFAESIKRFTGKEPKYIAKI